MEGEPGEAEEARKRNELAVFLGYTFERGNGGATIGLDYAYWFTERFGVGPFVDLVLGDIEALAMGAGIWVRPFRCLEQLSFQVAPGVDITRAEDEHEHGEEGGRSWEVEPLLRLGVTYAFELRGGFRVMPSFYYDVIFPDKKAIVIGLTIGKEF